METTLGCGYLINDESVITDFYSPPSSIVDEDDDLFYSKENQTNLSMINKNFENEFKSLPLKLMSIETTTPPQTPRLIQPINNTIIDFQNMKINDINPTNLSLNTPFISPCVTNKTSTNLLTPTSMDRYLIEHRRLAFGSTIQNRHQSISVQHTEVTNGLYNKSHSETSRLYSYMTPMDGLPSSTLDNTYMKTRQVQDPWFLSEMPTILRQNNNNNILLSTTAQQILNGNNRPLRSEKIDIEVIKHLIQEANWKRQCGMKREICVFCRNNGENELIYSSHSLKDPMGNVTCPILRAYQCPICGATGSQAHTIKYCQSTGDDNNRHVPTPYEKMLRMQTIGFDDNIPSIFDQFTSPSSLYSNGWSDSYL